MIQRIEGFELPGLLFSSSFDSYAGPENPVFDYPGAQGGFAESMSSCTAFQDVLATSEAGWVIGGAILVEGGQPNNTMFIGLGNGTEMGFIITFLKDGGNVNMVLRTGNLTGPAISSGTVSVFPLGNTDEWINFECKVLLKTDATGTVEVRKNGIVEPLVNLTGKNTVKFSMPDGCRTILFHTNSVGHFDDLRWLTTSGAAPNDFLGIKQVFGRPLEAVGVSSQFSPVGGANNLVTLTDGLDTTYNASATNGARDLFSVEDFTPVTSSVDAVQLQVRGGAASLGTREVKLIMRESGGTEALSDSFFITSLRRGGLTMITGEKPSGGAWDLTAADGLQVGYQISN